MKKFLSLLLAAICSFTLCAGAFATAPADDVANDPMADSLGDELQDSAITENQDSSIRQAIRMISPDEPESAINSYDLFSPRSGDLTFYGSLPNAGDSEAYTFEIDHEILPKVLLCVHPFLTTNDFVVEIYRESTQTSWQTTTQNMISELVFTPKMFLTLSNSDSIMETYTITFKALTDNTNYSFTLGTLDTFAEDFGGSDVIATVPSNAPDEKLESIGMTKYFSGYQALLNTGEWFHYRADGETYITARIAKRNSLAFIVINADTGEIEYESQDTDRRILNVSDTEWHGCVQKRLDLEPGGNYLIGFYSTEYIPTDDVMNDNYYIWIGYPYFTNEKISYASASYSVSAGTKRTFTFTLSGFTKSARANNMTRFYATGGKKSMDPRIKSCQITAPNGQTFQAQLGYYGSLPAAVFFNYLNNPSNIPLNGTWKVTVEAADDIPDFNFRISGHVLTIVGNDGN